MQRKRIWPTFLILAVLLIIGVPGLAQAPHNITLTWVAGSGGGAPTSYNILRGTAAGAESATPIATVPATQLTYVDTTGAGGTKYFYEITATNSAGTSGPSTEVSATFFLAPPLPPASVAATSN